MIERQRLGKLPLVALEPAEVTHRRAQPGAIAQLATQGDALFETGLRTFEMSEPKFGQAEGVECSGCARRVACRAKQLQTALCMAACGGTVVMISSQMAGSNLRFAEHCLTYGVGVVGGRCTCE